MERVVLYPSPFMNHITSMVELAKHLLTQSPSLSITIIIPNFPLNTTSSFTRLISSLSSSFPSITFLSLPSISLLYDNVSRYADFLHMIFDTLQRNTPNLLQPLQSLSLSSTISALILDCFCFSALEISRSLKIPTYYFFSSGASVFSFALNLPVYDRTFTGSFRDLQVSLQIPGLFNVPTTHLSDETLDRGVSYNEIIKMSNTLCKSDGIIINTFEGLEIRAVKGLKQGIVLPGTRIPPVYCVGPLISHRDCNNGGKGRHECLTWLDSQPSRTVVYLCFGSAGLFSKEQLWEIAFGLDTSRVRFLWVVRSPNKNDMDPDLDTILPEGFLDRTKDRGLVVKVWVPQIEVLGHEAIGGFVTHCGWNSILEAICAGVPMVAWPLYAEQRFNKLLIVEEIGIALPMNGSKDRFVSSSEIMKRVKQIISSEERDVIKERVVDLKDKARDALNEGGSSIVDWDLFVESWKQYEHKV